MCNLTLYSSVEVMSDAEDQQNFVAHSGDEVPDHGLDEFHNGLEYQVHDETLGHHQPYEVQDPILEPHQYQPRDQEQYQLQHQAHGEAQDHDGNDGGDQVDEGEEGVPEHVESLQKAEPEGDSTVGGEEKRWPGWPGETVFRMLVPPQKVGSIIGRKGDVIKKIVEETRARIKILDGPPGTTERAVSL